MATEIRVIELMTYVARGRGLPETEYEYKVQYRNAPDERWATVEVTTVTDRTTYDRLAAGDDK